MKLLIEAVPRASSIPEEKIIDYKTFSEMFIQPFIASTKWEEIIVNLDGTNAIGRGFFGGIAMLGVPIKVIFTGNVTAHTIFYLTELFPNIAAKIRKTFTEQDSIPTLLQQEGIPHEQFISMPKVQ